MSPDEAAAIRYALLHETNGAHLTGFASALAPEEAVAASLLFARAQVLERRHELGRDRMRALLDAVNHVASEPPEAYAEPGLTAQVAQLRAFAAARGLSPLALEHAVLAAAGDVVAKPSTSIAALPPPAQALVLGLIASLDPQITPPVLVLKPIASSLLRADPGATNAAQRAERARWVRQYLRESVIRA